MALSLSKGMLGVGCFFAFAFGTVHAAGFTEPLIAFYGKVTNTADGYALDLTQGQLTVSVQPSTGPALNFTTQLDAVGGGYSYKLKIPVEKVPSGFTVTTGGISAPTRPRWPSRSPSPRASSTGAYIQTHLAENFEEIEKVKPQFSWAQDYTGVYDQCRLLTPRTVLGHGIHLTRRERESSGPAATSLPTKVPRISPLRSASAVPWVAR